MSTKPPSVETLIRTHSKARVIKAAPVGWNESVVLKRRVITDRDVVESMVRKYAK